MRVRARVRRFKAPNIVVVAHMVHPRHVCLRFIHKYLNLHVPNRIAMRMTTLQVRLHVPELIIPLLFALPPQGM